MPKDVTSPIELAAGLAPDGAKEKYAFTLLTRGLEYHVLDRADLEELVRDLTARRAAGYEELMFEPRGENRLRVSFLGEHVECLAVPVIDAIERLVKAWHEE